MWGGWTIRKVSRDTAGCSQRSWQALVPARRGRSTWTTETWRFQLRNRLASAWWQHKQMTEECCLVLRVQRIVTRGGVARWLSRLVGCLTAPTTYGECARHACDPWAQARLAWRRASTFWKKWVSLLKDRQETLKAGKQVPSFRHRKINQCRPWIRKRIIMIVQCSSRDSRKSS